MSFKEVDYFLDFILYTVYKMKSRQFVDQLLSHKQLILLKFMIAGILNLQQSESLTISEEGP